MAIPGSDPRAKDLDSAFEAAMTGPARPQAIASAPPEVDHDAPHGRDENGDPLAPFGLTKDGRPKLTKGGLLLKDSADRPRTTEAGEQPEGGGEKAKPTGKNYMADLSNFADAVWFGTSVLGSVGSQIPLIGKLVPEQKIAAEAFVLSEAKPRLVAAVNLAAQHNVKAQEFCKKLEGGDGFWALQCMFMVMPVVSMSVAVWQGDKALAEMDETGETTLKSLEAKNKDRMEDFMARIAAQMQAAEQEAMATPGEVVKDVA